MVSDAQAWLASRATGDIEHGLKRARETNATGVVWTDEESPDLSYLGDDIAREEYANGKLSCLSATLVVNGKPEAGVGQVWTYDILFNAAGRATRREVEHELVAEYIDREEGVERLVREGFAL